MEEFGFMSWNEKINQQMLSHGAPLAIKCSQNQSERLFNWTTIVAFSLSGAQMVLE